MHVNMWTSARNQVEKQIFVLLNPCDKGAFFALFAVAVAAALFFSHSLHSFDGNCFMQQTPIHTCLHVTYKCVLANMHIKCHLILLSAHRAHTHTPYSLAWEKWDYFELCGANVRVYGTWIFSLSFFESHSVYPHAQVAYVNVSNANLAFLLSSFSTLSLSVCLTGVSFHTTYAHFDFYREWNDYSIVFFQLKTLLVWILMESMRL